MQKEIPKQGTVVEDAQFYFARLSESTALFPFQGVGEKTTDDASARCGSYIRQGERPAEEPGAVEQLIWTRQGRGRNRRLTSAML